MDIYISKTPEETEAFGESFAARLDPCAVVCLMGDLGAGKTCLVRGLARGLGFKGRVHSPTFALVQTYPCGDNQIYHMDLYRLSSPADFDSSGLEEMMDDRGVKIIEWAEYWPGGFLIPHWDLKLKSLSETTRSISYEYIVP